MSDRRGRDPSSRPAWPAIWILVAVSAGVCGARAASPKSTIASGDCIGGYRQQSSIEDRTLGRSWAIFASCLHPEMPRLAFLEGGRVERPFDQNDNAGQSSALASAITSDGRRAGLQAPAARVTATSIQVELGSRVRLWRRDARTQIDLAAVALESGPTGASIRVRLRPGGVILRGIVRAPGSVELEPREASGFSGGGL